MWGATCTFRISNTGGLNFNPRSPCGERHSYPFSKKLRAIYFNPRSPCGERHCVGCGRHTNNGISILAPRVGSDVAADTNVTADDYFNPRSPCGERRRACGAERCAAVFQSSLPVWGATSSLPVLVLVQIFQSSLPVWGATGQHRLSILRQVISILAPRVGSDVSLEDYYTKLEVFQSSLPVWGATALACLTSTAYIFQSSLPVWGATSIRAYALIVLPISILAPRVGSDRVLRVVLARVAYFNPRSPCGERQAGHVKRVGGT